MTDMAGLKILRHPLNAEPIPGSAPDIPSLVGCRARSERTCTRLGSITCAPTPGTRHHRPVPRLSGQVGSFANYNLFGTYSITRAGIAPNLRLRDGKLSGIC